MDNHGTHRLFVKLAHQVLAAQPAVAIGDDLELLKRSCSAKGVAFANSGELVAALNSARWQRRPPPRRPRVPTPAASLRMGGLR